MTANEDSYGMAAYFICMLGFFTPAFAMGKTKMQQLVIYLTGLAWIVLWGGPFFWKLIKWVWA